MLFEMMLMKFDFQELKDAAALLGPVCFVLFILVVVFVCMSMFITIIGDNFRTVRGNMRVTVNEDEQVLKFAVRKIQRWLGLRKEEMMNEDDERLRLTYCDPIENFPDKIDQLLAALDRVRLSTLLVGSAYVFFISIRSTSLSNRRLRAMPASLSRNYPN